jgi:hypothetical protein
MEDRMVSTHVFLGSFNIRFSSVSSNTAHSY